MLGHHHSYRERKDPAHLTPEYEDCGLFKSDVLSVQVELTPIIYRNSRNDLIVRGFNRGTKSFEVVFAGRRAMMAAPLVASLEAMKAARAKQLKLRDTAFADLESCRAPVRIEGAWRRRFWTDANGWQNAVNQLVVARWFLEGPANKHRPFGSAPAIGPIVH